MKKLYFVFALFAALVFVVSCGSSSSSDNNSVTNFGKLGSECYPNKTCDAGLLCDEESNTCVEDPENPVNDSDNSSQQTDDNTDTSSEQNNADSGDTNPDDTDSTPNNDTDSGDSAPDSDDGDTTNENPSNLPECSSTSATPCIDSETINSDSEKTNLIWSGKAPERMRWIDAVDYCKNLNEGGYSDWQLPTIAALETLVKECESSGYSDGECSKFGDIAFFWSSNQGQGVFFYNGGEQSKSVDESFDARCVRCESEIRQVACTELSFTNAEWNSVSNITQTWDWKKLLWTPSRISRYNNEESSTSECRFTCPNNNCKDSSSGLIWSAKAQEAMKWNAAVTYCDNLTESGYSDWRLPTIDELKTLLIWSKANSCKVSETNNCLAWDGCWTCETCTEQGTASPSDNTCSNWGNSYSDGRYSKFGENGWFWSSSLRSGNSNGAWIVNFSYGSVEYSNIGDIATTVVRCVR